jgi:hypothetical protein
VLHLHGSARPACLPGGLEALQRGVVDDSVASSALHAIDKGRGILQQLPLLPLQVLPWTPRDSQLLQCERHLPARCLLARAVVHTHQLAAPLQHNRRGALLLARARRRLAAVKVAVQQVLHRGLSLSSHGPRDFNQEVQKPT